MAQHMHGKLRYLFRGTIGLMALRITSVGLGMTVSAILARTLGAEEFGIFAFAISIATLLALPLTGGLPMLLLREIAAARAEAHLERALGVIRWGYMTLFAVTAALVFFCVLVYAVAQSLELWGWDDRQTAIALIVMAIVPVMGFLHVQRGILGGHERPVLGALGEQLFRPLAMVALLLVTAPFFHFESLGALGLQLVATVVAALATMVAMQKVRVRSELSPEIQWREWALALMPLTALTATGVIANNSDILMLGILQPPEEVGVYRIAAQVAMLAAILMQILRTLSAPRIAADHATGDIEAMRLHLVYSGRFMSAGALVFVVLFIFFGRYLLTLTFGSDYAAAFGPCLVLSLGTLFSASCGLVGVALQVTRHAGLVARAAVVAAIINVILNLVLIPTYGTIGAAIGTSIALVGMQGQLWWAARRVLGLRTDIFQRIGT